MIALISESAAVFRGMQDSVSSALERCDGKGVFREDRWTRADQSGGEGGGGITRILSEGALFEKAGVNFSQVHGRLPADMCRTLTGTEEELPFEATGTSLVIHPRSPAIPTIHANVRCIRVDDRCWFGGGIDLTPYTLREGDIGDFHRGLKDLCDRHDTSFYPRFKKECDAYFYIKHRNETRGVGGIFFDYLGKDEPEKISAYASFARSVAERFNDLYLPIVERRASEKWTDSQKRFQLLRRGRYVEFNLMYDRGTLFGLKTNGRVESILMSLPLHASWEYDFTPAPGTDEEALSEIFRHPRAWV